MMPGATLIVTGLVLMAPVKRMRLVLQPVPGNELREAFIAPTLEPVPDEMRTLTDRIAGPLRVVGGRQA